MGSEMCIRDSAGRCSPPRTPCIGSFAERAGRCSTLRTPCTGSLSERAGRCPPLRTPCTGSFAGCAHIAPACPLVLASLLRCLLRRLRLAPPAYCCPLLSAPSPPCCRLNHPSALIGLPRFLHYCSPCRCPPSEPLLSHCQRASCPCRRRQRHQPPRSSPFRHPQPPDRPLPMQAPCPCLCCRCRHLLAPQVIPASPHLPRLRRRRPRAPRPLAPCAVSAWPPLQPLPPLPPDLSDQ